MENYIYNLNLDILENEKKILNFLRNNANTEIGGNRIYNGDGSHIMQNPEELTWLIKQIKLLEKKKFKFNNYLEFGYANGVTNTILHKFINFKKIVTVDYLDHGTGNKFAFFSNLKFKNLIFIAGDSRSEFVKDQIQKNKEFDMVFVDGGHDYDVVENDFNIAIKNIKKKKSIIVFHDVFCDSFSGPVKFWKKIKKEYKPKKNCSLIDYCCKKYHSKYGLGIIIFN